MGDSKVTGFLEAPHGLESKEFPEDMMAKLGSITRVFLDLVHEYGTITIKEHNLLPKTYHSIDEGSRSCGTAKARVFQVKGL